MEPDQPDIYASLPAQSFANLPQSTTAATLQPVSPDNPPWGIGGGALTWVGSVLIMAIVQIVMIFGYALYRHVDLLNLQDFLLHDKTAIFVTALSLLPTHIATLALIWAVVTRFGKYPFWETIGWQWGRGFTIWKCAGLAILLLGVGTAITRFFGEQTTPLDDMISRSMGARYVIAILATFTAPLTEEFVYRGVLFPALQRRIGPVLAVIGVLLLFTVIHVPQYWPNYGVILTIGVLSLVLTAIRSYTGRILPCVAIHTVFNGIQSFWIVLEPHIGHPVARPPDAQGLLHYAIISLARFIH